MSGSCANKYPFSASIIGPRGNGVTNKFPDPVANFPSYTLVTAAPTLIGLNSIDSPSAATDETLLNVSVLNPGLWYEIIVSVLIPLKTFPVAVTVATPLVPKFPSNGIDIWSMPLGILNFSRTESAVNCGKPPPAACLTDLIFWVPYSTNSLIVLGKSTPLTVICSPLAKEPDVPLKLMNSVPPPASTRYPLAPLLLPLMYDPSGMSVASTSLFKVILVYVWTSYNLKSYFVAAPEYAASVRLNVYTLASPITDSVSPFFLFSNWIVALFCGTPVTLFTLSKLPISNGIVTLDSFWVSLGFSTSIIVVETFSTSYPLTYAFPGDILKHIKSSDGTFLCSVNSLEKKRPLLPSLLFNELWTDGSNGSTA